MSGREWMRRGVGRSPRLRVRRDDRPLPFGGHGNPTRSVLPAWERASRTATTAIVRPSNHPRRIPHPSSTLLSPRWQTIAATLSKFRRMPLKGSRVRDHSRRRSTTAAPDRSYLDPAPTPPTWIPRTTSYLSLAATDFHLWPINPRLGLLLLLTSSSRARGSAGCPASPPRM